MDAVKSKKSSKRRAASTRLSPKELRRLADKLVATKDPVEASRLKEQLERGFYGDPHDA